MDAAAVPERVRANNSGKRRCRPRIAVVDRRHGARRGPARRRWAHGALCTALSSLLWLTASPAQQCTPAPPEPLPNGGIYVGGTLVGGFGIGVDTDLQERAWLSCAQRDCPEDCCRMSLPSGQSFGAVFVTVGPPAAPPRPSVDVRGFTCLEFDLRAQRGVTTDTGEIGILDVGIKDSCDPDNGSETKVTLQIPLADELIRTGHDPWVAYAVPLGRFATADLEHVYVPIEFVFDVNRFQTEPPQTIDFREIRLTNGSCEPTPTATATGTATPTPPPTATKTPTATATPLPSTQLAADIDAAATEIPLQNANGFPSTGVLIVGSERILYRGRGSNPDTVIALRRGFAGTSAAPHLAGDRVDVVPICGGDCNGDASVTVSDLVTMVSIALDLSPVGNCWPGDADGDGALTIAEIIAAVNRALGVCG